MMKRNILGEMRQDSSFRKNKLLDGIVLAAGMCAMAVFGLTAQAEVPQDLWEYTSGTNEDGSIFCSFKEVEVTLPSGWSGTCGISRNQDMVNFYHLASREAYREETGGDGGGRLFSICWSEDYEFTKYLGNYKVLGEGDQGVYYADLPSDVQGYIEDNVIWTEWQSLASNVDWVVDHITVVPYGEMNSSAEQGTLAYENPEAYILPDSSVRLLTEEELQHMDYNELQMAINEIYARHHRRFVMEGVQSYFDTKSWYTGTIAASDFDTSVINQIEWKNIELMLKLMEQRK